MWGEGWLPQIHEIRSRRRRKSTNASSTDTWRSVGSSEREAAISPYLVSELDSQPIDRSRFAYELDGDTDIRRNISELPATTFETDSIPPPPYRSNPNSFERLDLYQDHSVSPVSDATDDVEWRRSTRVSADEAFSVPPNESNNTNETNNGLVYGWRDGQVHLNLGDNEDESAPSTGIFETRASVNGPTTADSGRPWQERYERDLSLQAGIVDTILSDLFDLVASHIDNLLSQKIDAKLNKYDFGRGYYPTPAASRGKTSKMSFFDPGSGVFSSPTSRTGLDTKFSHFDLRSGMFDTRPSSQFDLHTDIPQYGSVFEDHSNFVPSYPVYSHSPSFMSDSPPVYTATSFAPTSVY